MMQETRYNGVAHSNLKAMLDAYERQLIQSALQAANGNQRRAAALLGLLPTTLHEKMKRLGLTRPGARRMAPSPEEMVTEPEEMATELG
jgi:DNA-binding NtrC family response regulator